MRARLQAQLRRYLERDVHDGQHRADLTPTIEQLAAADKHLTLTLADEEDQATFDLAGQTTLTGTWKPTGEDTCAITFEGYEEIPATLSEGALTFEESGQTMTCTKQE